MTDADDTRIRDVLKAEQAQREADAARRAQAAEQSRQREETERLRQQLEREAAEWLDEQKAAEATGSNREEHDEAVRRIKERAEEALSQSEQANLELLNDVAAQLSDRTE